jgi:hypothetical protein
MRLTRRNALIGLGTVAAGAGVVGGSGAFTSVTAERTVSVETAGDASAALALVPAVKSTPVSSADNTPNADYVSGGGSSGTTTINLDGSNTGTSPINKNANTVFEDLVTVVNNGTQEVTSLELEFSSVPSAINSTSDTFGFTASTPDDSTEINFHEVDNNGDDTVDLSPPIDILNDNSSSLSLGVGSVVNFGIVVDLLDGGNGSNDLPDTGSYTLTITAGTS